MLLEKIDQDLKVALKEKNEIAVSSLRNLKAAIKNSEIEKRQSLTDDEVLGVIAKKVKQHKDSIEGFTAGSRSDLVEHETGQMQILQKYLPKQMDEAELANIVTKIISRLNATNADFGKVMKEVVAQVKGQADGSMVTRIVKAQLAKK